MSDETKLACGCHAEWTGERWQVAASSFLCDHNQGDPVDGAVPLPGQPDLLNVAKHHAPGVVHQYLVETVAALAAAEAECKSLAAERRETVAEWEREGLRMSAENRRLVAERDRLRERYDEATAHLYGIVEADKQDAMMGHPNPGDSCIGAYISLVLMEYLDGLTRAISLPSDPGNIID